MKELELLLQGFSIELSKITLAINEMKAATEKKSIYDDIPAWVTIDLAAKLKGGFSLSAIKNRLFLQPCCGTNYKFIGGRKCWRREDVLTWLEITDSDLKAYAEKWKVSIPLNYERRSA
ncbi:hypothetical protein FACS189447_07750 [Spirochaetia bacterium]|nr:hypothetical protein FACS189447_07750 [Spirochaetia bacterium]